MPAALPGGSASTAPPAGTIHAGPTHFPTGVGIVFSMWREPAAPPGEASHKPSGSGAFDTGSPPLRRLSMSAHGLLPTCGEGKPAGASLPGEKVCPEQGWMADHRAGHTVPDIPAGV